MSLIQTRWFKVLLGPVGLFCRWIVDTLRNYLGPPRFVPLILGMPSDDDFAREERGEVMLRSCISKGNDPRWVLVW